MNCSVFLSAVIIFFKFVDLITSFIFCVSVQEEDAQMLPHLSQPNTSANMEDRDKPLLEEGKKEITVLDPDHVCSL